MAYSNTISSWAFNDANAAGNWLGRQDQGPELDQARQQFASSVVQKDPVSAMAWADAITDDSKRVGAVQNVYMQWAGKDRAAADVALEGTNLSEDKITELKGMEIKASNHTLLHGYGAAALGTRVTTEVEVTEEKVAPADEVPESVPEAVVE